MPARIAALPLDPRGYPIPWFVAYIDGKPDFRVADSGKRYDAVRHEKCWVCGQRLGAHKVFVAGPMCGVNRTSSEPPLHRDCAEWSVRACPFLLIPTAKRREANLPADSRNTPGITIPRNPGATLLWVTKHYTLFRDRGPGQGGWLFRMGDPLQVLWFYEGRPATRAEVVESMETGLPILREMAEVEGPNAVRELRAMADHFMPYLPQE